MPKYVIGPQRAAKADLWGSDPMLPALQVPDAVNVDTGLVDHAGRAIMRAPEPMGFGSDRKWGSRA